MGEIDQNFRLRVAAHIKAIGDAPDHFEAWRADEVTDGAIPEKITANAPDPQNGMFAVPKVLE